MIILTERNMQHRQIFTDAPAQPVKFGIHLS